MTDAYETLAGTDLTAPDIAGIDPAVLEAIQRHAYRARGAYAPNTGRALRADIAVFTAWCRATSSAPLPATPETLATFIDVMAADKAPATIRRYVASIAVFHRAGGLDSPSRSTDAALAIKRMHRRNGRTQRQAAPLNRELVDRMLRADGDTPRHHRDRALLAIAYDTLCRRYELVALRVQDLECGSAGDGTITIRSGKTDPEGAGSVRYLAPDTMRLVMAWLEVAGITEGALLRAVRKGGRIGAALSDADVARRFKAMAARTGIAAADVGKISGHSSRVGAAQDMVRHGVDLPAIMQAGGWRSAEMVACYIARLDARRSGAAKLALLQDRA